VRKSQIPNAGYGLFAVRRFAKDTIIGHYTGKLYPLSEVDKLDRTYILCNTHKECVDASDPRSTPFRYMNDPRNTRFRANVKFTNGRKFPVKTMRLIRPGDELFVEYGDEYWS